MVHGPGCMPSSLPPRVMKSQISDFKSRISNLSSQISNLRSNILPATRQVLSKRVTILFVGDGHFTEGAKVTGKIADVVAGLTRRQLDPAHATPALYQQTNRIGQLTHPA